MLNAQSEFDRRCLEVDEYVTHLEALEKLTGMSVTLMNTMKSSALLMIYNIVESTMTNLMQDIFDKLHAESVSFDSLNGVMKTLVLGYTRRRNPKALVEKMLQLQADLSVACFDRTDIFSGNLDARKIKETLRELGIASRHTYTEAALLTVKTERNDLAHGIKSFSDCGRTYSATQLREMHDKTVTLLRKVISDFENFLNTKAFA